MKNEKKYVWLSPDLSFSQSFSEEEYKKHLNDDYIKEATLKGWRLIRHQVVFGKDFDFPFDSILIKKPKK